MEYLGTVHLERSDHSNGHSCLLDMWNRRIFHSGSSNGSDGRRDQPWHPSRLGLGFHLLRFHGPWPYVDRIMCSGHHLQFLHRMASLSDSDQRRCRARLGFHFLFATGVLMLGMEAENAHIDPECILYGEIGFTPLAPDLKLGSLRLGNQALWTMGGVFLSVAIAAVVFYRQILISSFDPILARSMGTPVRQVHLGLMLSLSLATVASLEAVGVILVVAMFVFPAVTASFFFDRLSSIVFFSLPLGLAYSIGGFHLAHWFDCSLAASMVVFAGLLFIPCCFLAPNSGILWKITSLRNVGR